MQSFYLVFALQTFFSAIATMWLLFRWDSLFRSIRVLWLRQLSKIFVVTCTFYAAFIPANHGWQSLASGNIGLVFLAGSFFYMNLLVISTSFIFMFIKSTTYFKQLSAETRDIASFCFIAFLPVIAELIIAPLFGFGKATIIVNLGYTLFMGCCAAMFYLFFTNYNRAKEFEIQQKELQLTKLNNLKTQAELDALQARINPHFLYNALSAMAGLALEDGRRASKMAVELSKLFRYGLNKEQQSLVRIEEEVEIAETYLKIEKIRFEDRLDYETSIEEGIENRMIPKFLLQPLAENAIKHAFVGQHQQGRIGIKIAKMADNKIQIVVEDNGKPFPEEMMLGYGLKSVYDKLALLFPNRHEIEIRNEPQKAIVIILML